MASHGTRDLRLQLTTILDGLYECLMQLKLVNQQYCRPVAAVKLAYSAQQLSNWCRGAAGNQTRRDETVRRRLTTWLYAAEAIHGSLQDRILSTASRLTSRVSSWYPRQSPGQRKQGVSAVRLGLFWGIPVRGLLFGDVFPRSVSRS